MARIGAIYVQAQKQETPLNLNATKSNEKKNRKEKNMSRRTTPMNLNQGSNEKMRKTHRSIYDKCIKKCTSLDRNWVQMRDGLDRIARNPEEQVMNLGQLMRSDPRINTPLNGSTSQI